MKGLSATEITRRLAELQDLTHARTEWAEYLLIKAGLDTAQACNLFFDEPEPPMEPAPQPPQPAPADLFEDLLKPDPLAAPQPSPASLLPFAESRAVSAAVVPVASSQPWQPPPPPPPQQQQLPVGATEVVTVQGHWPQDSLSQQQAGRAWLPSDEWAAPTAQAGTAAALGQQASWQEQSPPPAQASPVAGSFKLTPAAVQGSAARSGGWQQSPHRSTVVEPSGADPRWLWGAASRGWYQYDRSTSARLEYAYQEWSRSPATASKVPLLPSSAPPFCSTFALRTQRSRRA